MLEILFGLPVALGVGAVVFWFAKKRGFFSYPIEAPPRWINFLIILIALAIPVGFVFAIPRTSLNVILLSGYIGGALIFYSLALGWRGREMWGDWRQAIYGVYALPVALSFVAVVGMVCLIPVILVAGSEELPEQVPMEHLRAWLGDPSMMVALAFSIVIFSPVAEELIFRGFIQSFLRKWLPRQWALILVAILFGFIHFAISQGISNLLIVPATATLGWFLGHVYEKTRSLWAPIVLHAIWNGGVVALKLLIFSLGWE